MMRRRVAIAAVGGLLLPMTLQADDETRRDGNWWRAQTKALKVCYMIGFFDGMELGKKFWVFGESSG